MKNKIVKINSLNEPLSFFGGKTWIVLTVSKADVEPFFSKKDFEKLKDEDMSYIAEKLGDALMDCYWNSLSTICQTYGK